MAIKSTFFATRTLARNAKAELGGKVVDNGSTAEAGKRWELQTEEVETVNVANKAAWIKAEAIAQGLDVVDVPMAKVTQREMMGLPRPVSKGANPREYTLKDRKGHSVLVQVRRSKTNALLAAHMAKA